MKANVFRGKNNIRIEEVDKPRAGVGEAVIRVTLTTICGTDLHIVRGEYPVAPGLVIGHEPVGVIEELGEGVSGYEIGDRVLVGAITPCGQCSAQVDGGCSPRPCRSHAVAHTYVCSRRHWKSLRPVW
jgi:alcohol dehydrogenase